MFKIKPFRLFLERPPRPVCICCGHTFNVVLPASRCFRCGWPRELRYEDSPFESPPLMEGYPVPPGGEL